MKKTKADVIKTYQALADIASARGYSVWFKDYRASMNRGWLLLYLLDENQDPVIHEKSRRYVYFRVTRRAMAWLVSRREDNKDQAMNVWWHVVTGIA